MSQYQYKFEWLDFQTGDFIVGEFKTSAEGEAFGKCLSANMRWHGTTGRKTNEPLGITYSVADMTKYYESAKEWAGDYQFSGRD